MNNVKDTLTTIAGLVMAVATSLLALHFSGKFGLSSDWVGICFIADAVGGAIIGYLNGKTAEGKKKSVEELINQKQMND